MPASRSLAALVACAALLALPAASPAAGPELPIGAAADRSARFAERLCDRDRNCVRHGVLNCRREAARVVICRIFDERDTRAQGRYECNRLIRVGFDPATGRVPVTGLGRWHC